MIALPDHVRIVNKANGRKYCYFEKFRGTPAEWPRVRVMTTDALSEEFARVRRYIEHLQAIKTGNTWAWAFFDVTGRRHELPDPSGTEAFWKAIDKADDIGKKLAAGERKTFSALIVDFKNHAAYTDNIGESTRDQYDRAIDLIEAAWGDDPVASLTAVDIQTALDKGYRETPSAGRVFRSTLGRIIKWGIPRGYRLDNPVENTEKFKDAGTYPPWKPEAFNIFFENVRIDLHMPVYSALFTGQRKSDVVLMLRPKSTATEMPLVATKTSDTVPVQIHSEYRTIIDASPPPEGVASLMLHLRADGEPWTYEGLKTAWGREMDKPAMAIFRANRWVFHGLRKNAVNMLLEVGCTEEQVASIVGMSAAMVHHYSKEVSKFRLARSAMKVLEAGWAAQRIHVLGARKSDMGGK